jgi:hypothetical protein
MDMPTSQNDFLNLVLDTENSNDAGTIKIEEREGISEAWLARLSQQLEEMKDLSDNWNGYGSAAPNAIAFRTATNILFVLHQLGFSPTQIAPSAEEGIGFFFVKEEKYAFIECYNDGEIVIAMSNRQGERQVREVGTSVQEIKEALDLLRIYINA